MKYSLEAPFPRKISSVLEDFELLLNLKVYIEVYFDHISSHLVLEVLRLPKTS